MDVCVRVLTQCLVRASMYVICIQFTWFTSNSIRLGNLFLGRTFFWNSMAFQPFDNQLNEAETETDKKVHQRKNNTASEVLIRSIDTCRISFSFPFHADDHQRSQTARKKSTNSKESLKLLIYFSLSIRISSKLFVLWNNNIWMKNYGDPDGDDDDDDAVENPHTIIFDWVMWNSVKLH